MVTQITALDNTPDDLLPLSEICDRFQIKSSWLMNQASLGKIAKYKIPGKREPEFSINDVRELTKVRKIEKAQTDN